MKKTILTFFLIIAAISFTKAQKNKAQVPEPYEIKLEVYHKALMYNDMAAARTAVYEMMVLKPEVASWRDTLTILYFSSGMYDQAIYLGKELLKEKSTDQLLLEIVAVSEENLGMAKQSLEDYDKLFALSGSLVHQYKIAALQYTLQRYGECSQTLSVLIGNPAAATEKVAINVGQGQGQDVTLLAAAWNIAGMIAVETGQAEDARKCFEKSLAADPEFLLPKNNISYLDSKKQQP